MSGMDPDRELWARFLRLEQNTRALKAGAPRLLPGRTADEPRIFAIWDFRVVPHTLGDLLQCHMRTQLMRHEHGVDKVDLAFLMDPAQPSRTLNYDAGVRPHNFHHVLPALTAGAYLNRHLGSLFIFDSAAALEAHLAANLHRYHVWPTAWQYFHGEDAFGDNHNAVQDFHARHGFIPYFDCRPAAVQWCRDFYEQQVAPNLMVVLHLRNNAARDLERNSHVDEWHRFVAGCADRHPVRFVLIGSQAEVDPRFRELPNVIVAKDHGSTLEQDFVLVRSAHLFCGTGSGPASMAIYSDTPYLIFIHHPPAFERITQGGTYPFATAQQRMIWHDETAETISGAFEELLPALDPAAWSARLESGLAGADSVQTKLLWDR